MYTTENRRVFHETYKMLVINDFLNFQKQKAALIGQFSFWPNIESIVSQELILESLLFFIYINDFFDNLTANAK